jgi:hypothetical protein
MTKPGLGSGIGNATTLFQQFVKRCMLRVHFRAPHRINHDRSRVRRAVRSPCRRH